MLRNLILLKLGGTPTTDAGTDRARAKFELPDRLSIIKRDDGKKIRYMLPVF